MSRGERLSKIISERGYSVMSLSKKSGVAYTTIRSMIERDLKNVSFTNIIRVCEILNIKTDDLSKEEYSFDNLNSLLHNNNFYSLGQRLKYFRLQHNLTIDDFIYKYNIEFDTSISKSMVSRWENNLAEPKISVGRNIAVIYGISFDELVGISNRNELTRILPIDKQTNSTKKDERDIAANISAILKRIDHKGDLLFNGKVLDAQTKDLISTSIKYSYDIARIKTEQKKDKE